jgi:hypothetical protein
MVAAGTRWVWDAGFDNWLNVGYFGHELAQPPKACGVPHCSRRLSQGCFFQSHRVEETSCAGFSTAGSSRGSSFYAFGAEEIVQNPWNLHIVDPALAGLAAQGLLVGGAALARLHLPPIARVAVILIILAMHGLAMSHLQWAYREYARQGYELGAALARISRPSDLVVTVANAIGDPAAIYYSRRRGWVFPPVWPGADPWEDIKDEPAAIQLFDRLRVEGARWFGIVAEQRMKFRKTAPRLFAHIERTTELVAENRDWAIYQIPRSQIERARPLSEIERPTGSSSAEQRLTLLGCHGNACIDAPSEAERKR